MWILQANTYACLTCRIAQKRSGHCARGHDMVSMGRFWRAPKRNNIRAWKRVASGDHLWHDRSIERKAKREALKMARHNDYLKFKERNKGKKLNEILEDYRKYRWGRWEK